MNIENIKSYVIHLKNRTDREVNMINELDNFCGIGNYEIFDAIKNPTGYIGTSNSFKEIIKKAKKLKLKEVLIFEDDVKFTSNKSREKFQKAIDSLPNDWSILLGGVYSVVDINDLNNKINEHLIKIGDFASLHCILINENCYDTILKHNPSSKYKHLDRWIGYISSSKYGDLNTYLTYPMVAIQYNTFSDNIKNNVNYDKLLEKFELFT